MRNFNQPFNLNNNIKASLLGLDGDLDAKFSDRLSRIVTYQNFYEGYHWEDFPEQDNLCLTFNYCKAIVNQLVSFELGHAFTFTTHKSTSGKKVTDDGRTLFDYLEDVWEDNNQYALSEELGQMKSVTGEAWLQVRSYLPEDPELDDPFGEYPNGRLRIMLMPTSVVFPEYNPHDKGELVKLTIAYTYDKIVSTPLLGKTRKEKTLFKQVWTKDRIVTTDGKSEPIEENNKYGVIPFVCIRNITQLGETEGASDLVDVIPLNIEYNLKCSDISEIIDYHAAPVTIVYGAKVGNLEKGANKMWGGLPKDARIENLTMGSNLEASTSYLQEIKHSICEISGVPETMLGGAQSISNTSGVALHYMCGPLVDKNNSKKLATEDGLERLNKLIILISLLDGYIRKPEDITNRDFFHTEVTLPDNLPKDELLTLQQLQQEISMGVESRRGAMKRMGKEDIDTKIAEIDAEREKDAMTQNAFNLSGEPQLNSGLTNGNTPIEEVRKELTGQNGGGEI